MKEEIIKSSHWQVLYTLCIHVVKVYAYSLLLRLIVYYVDTVIIIPGYYTMYSIAATIHILLLNECTALLQLYIYYY